MNLTPTRTPMRRSGLRGFTMVELMVVVGVLAILAGLAVPSFTKLIEGQKIKTAASDLNSSLSRARSEAVKRNKSVTLAPLTGSDWLSGWAIADPDNAGASVEVHSPVPGLVVSGPASVTYQSSGRLGGGAGVSFDIGTLDAAASARRCVAIDLSGRPYVKAGAC